MKLTARGTLQLQPIMFCCSATIAAKVKDGRRVGGRAPETTPDQTPVSAFAALPGAPTCLCAMIVERLCRRHPAGGRRGAPGGLAAAPGAPGRAGRQRQADGLEWRGTRRVAAPHRIGLHSDQSQHPASPRRALQAPQQHLRSGLWRTRLPPLRRPAARALPTAPASLPPAPLPSADYTMKDVERLHEDEAARKRHLPADMSQWDGEGAGARRRRPGRGARRARACLAGIPARAPHPRVFACPSRHPLCWMRMPAPTTGHTHSHSHCCCFIRTPLAHADYGMKDVEAFHEAAKTGAGPGGQSVWNGEGPGEAGGAETRGRRRGWLWHCFVCRLICLSAPRPACACLPAARPPASMSCQQPLYHPPASALCADFDMRDVEAFHEAQKKPARGPDASQYNGEGSGACAGLSRPPALGPCAS